MYTLRPAPLLAALCLLLTACPADPSPPDADQGADAGYDLIDAHDLPDSPGPPDLPDTPYLPQTILPDQVTALAVGEGHTCALHAGSLYCLGYNEGGQLGEGGSMFEQPQRITLP